MPGRESEVVTVPKNFGTTEGREGPLLSSSNRNRERQPDCSRRERLHPGPIERSVKTPARLDNARKLQRRLYRVAKQQPERRFTLVYDKVCRQDILREGWQRVKSNKGAAGADRVDIDAIRKYGEDRFLSELEQELRGRQYRAALVRRVHIPKPRQPGKTRPLGIPTVKDRVVQMAVKIVITPGRVRPAAAVDAGSRCPPTAAGINPKFPGLKWT
jgi:RNA-directed DNA polymerase